MKMRIRIFKTRYISEANQIDMIVLMIFFVLISFIIYFVSYSVTYIGVVIFVTIKNNNLDNLAVSLLLLFICERVINRIIK